MMADIICCSCISKYMTKEALQNHYMYISRVRITDVWCEVGVFSREISQLSKIHPCTPLFEEPLKFIAFGHTFEFMVQFLPLSLSLSLSLYIYIDR